MSYKQFSVIIILTVFICPVSLSSAVLNVPAEYTTIADAIDAAGPCDTVLLATGTYSGAGFRDLHLDGRCLHFLSADGPEQTVIQLDGDERFLTISDTTETGTCDVSACGLTVSGGHAAIEVGANGRVDVRQCRFMGIMYGVVDTIGVAAGSIDSCLFSGCAVGLWAFSGSSGNDWVVTRSTFVLTGSGVSLYWVPGCVITDNVFAYGVYGLVLQDSDSCEVSNNLFYRNQDGITDWLATEVVSLNCNNYYGNKYNTSYFPPGDQIGINGNISADPMLCDTTLESISVLPNSPLLAENNDCGVNIGNVHEGCICADLNGTGGLPDISDLTFYVDYMFASGEPPIHINTADIDGIGGVNISDLTYFVDYLFASGPPPIC